MDPSIEVLIKFSELLSSARQACDRKREGEAYSYLGCGFYSVGKPQAAIPHLEKSLSIAIEVGDKKSEGVAYGNLGAVHRLLGKYDEAIKCHEKCLSIAIEIDAKDLEAESFGNLGVVYQLLGKYDKAVFFQEKCLSIAIKTGDKKSEGAAYGNLGVVYESLGKHEEAMRYQENFLSIATEIGDKNGVQAAYGYLGSVYRSLGRYKEAIKCQKKCLSIAKEKGDKNGEGIAYANLGAVHQLLGNYEKAISCQENSLSIAIEIGDKRSEGVTYGNLGAVHQMLGKYDEAVKCQEKYLTIAIEIGDKKGEGMAYGDLGVSYHSLGKYEEAIKCQKKHLSIALEIGDKHGEGAAYASLGAVYHTLGQNEEAIKCQEKFLRMAIETGDKRGEGVAYGNLGVIYQSIGKYDEAIKCQENCLRIVVEIGDKYVEGSAYGALGAIYQTLGKYDEAMKCHEKRLSIAVGIGDKRGEGKTYGNLGVVYQALGKYEKAIDYHKKLLRIAIDIGDKDGEGTAYGNLGIVYRVLEKYDEARKCQEKRLCIAIEIGDKKGEEAAYGSLGVVYTLLAKYEEAIKYQEKLLTIAKEIGDKEGEGIALHNLGYCYRDSRNGLDEESRQERLNKSANYLKEALQCMDWLFDHLEGRDKFKISIFDRFIHTYQMLTHVLLDLKQSEDALLVSERGRARALGDLLVSNYSLSQACSRSNPISRDDIKSLVFNGKHSILFFALYGNFITSWHLSHEKPIVCESFDQNQIRPLKASTSGESNQGYTDEFLAKTVEAAFGEMQVRARVDCEDRSLDILDENVDKHKRGDVAVEALSLLDRGNKVPLKSSDVQGGTRPRNAWSEEGEDDDTDHLEVLYEILTSVVQQNLTQDEIVIIPDGLLFKVPFAALRDPSTKLYLSDTKRVRLAPSLTTLRVLQESRADYHNSTGALIVGNPAVEDVRIKGKKETFKRLRGAEREALEISTLMGVTPLIGSQATKQAVLRRLQDGVGVVHIAAHGNTSGKILLAPSPSVHGVPEEQDCMLTMDEVQESGCRAQLVVLSCCHSSRGEIKAEGVVGLTRAFLAAGARAVVASLWAIDDKATKEFMLRFYSHLKNGESASASLQQAMKELRKIPSYSKPKYWAPFLLIGDDVTITHQTIFTYALRRIFIKPHSLLSPSPGHMFVH